MKEKIVLLVDPKSNVLEQAEKIKDYINNKGEIGADLVEIQIKKFRNGEKKIKIGFNVRKRECYFIQDSSKNPDEWFFELIATLYALKNSGAKEINAVLPCLLYSRQDRKDESRVAINAKVVADCISLYTNRVITIDLHADQIQGFYNIPLDNLRSFPVVVNYLKKEYSEFLDNLVLVASDAGAVKLIYAFSKKFEKEGIKNEIAIGSKHRPKEGEVDEFKIIGDIKNKNALIIDDIIDSGNTLVKCAETLKKGGAKEVYAYATHGIFTEGFEKLGIIDKIFVGDTFPKQNKKCVEVISLTELLGEAIYREATGKSLSELFD